MTPADITGTSCSRALDSDCGAGVGKSVLLGMSGGVDSSVASLLLRRQGWQVRGLTMITHDGGFAAAEDARAVCDTLSIPLLVVDVREAFRRLVVDDFISAYLMGLTPNPCIRCNPAVKFSLLIREADRLGCSAIATGHYAGIRRNPATGRLALLKTPSGRKDQTYFLHRLDQSQLNRLTFPLEGLQKPAVRQIAAEYGLSGQDGSSLAVKPDSQDICFIPDGNYTDFIRRELLRHGPSDALKLTEPGKTVDINGKTIGSHQGLIHYTVGQRKGFQVRTTDRLFVIGMELSSNTLIVGPYEQVLKKQIRVGEIVYSGAESFKAGDRLLARIRSSAREMPCQVEPEPDGDLAVTFEQPVSAPSPGQSCVFYDRDLIMAGGIIRMS
ncbi:MAG: tRNA 2-thiouridine(34) synthase MnmA [Clostridiaceae bacterium]|nr:tRNA 2-thiouridine(34) synthase MnmA [Clostridiaceae bacterium]